jgi:hypothetical protein
MNIFGTQIKNKYFTKYFFIVNIKQYWAVLRQ